MKRDAIDREALRFPMGIPTVGFARGSSMAVGNLAEGQGDGGGSHVRIRQDL